MGRVTIAVAVLMVLLQADARATTYLVRQDGAGDFQTIQAAVDAAMSGDLILVAAGEYNEDVLVPVKHLDFVAQQGAAETSVSSFSFTGSQWNPGGGSVNGFGVSGNLSAGSVVCLVLRKCEVQEDVAIWCYDPMMAYVEVDSCTFSAGLYVWGVTEAYVSFCSAPAMGIQAELTADIDHCDVSGGALEVSGGWSGYCYVHRCSLVDASLRIDGCVVALVSGNVVTGGNLEVHVTPVGTGGADVSENVIYDGGITIRGEVGAGAYLTGNTVYGCAGDGIEMELDPTQFVDLSNNIVAACARGIVWSSVPESLECRCNDVWLNSGENWIGIPDPAGVDGNISLDPLFCDPVAGDLALAASSPCLPGNPGNGDCGQIGALGLSCAPHGAVPVDGEATALFLVRSEPNPFSGATVLSCGVSASDPSTRVRLEIVDINGRVVRELVERTAASGAFRVQWNGTDDRGAVVPSGVYWSRLRVGHSETGERVVRIR